MKLANWLDEFKRKLVSDLDRQGFAYAIRGTNGAVLDGGVGSATDASINIKAPYGTIPLEWVKVSPDSVIAMATLFLNKERDPALAAERKWRLGLYECEFGRGKLGRPILAELAQGKPEYADSLEAILAISR